MAKGKGGFLGHNGLNAPDAPTGVSGTAGDTQVTVSFTAPSDVGGSAITGYNVQASDGSGTWQSYYDLENASYDSVTLSISSQDTAPEDIAFKTDGTEMYISGRTNGKIFQYTLTTAWDLSTASYASKSLTVSSQDTDPRGLAISSDGTKIYMAGDAGNDINQYNLSTAWDLSTGSYSQTFSVTSQVTTPQAVRFKSDGTKMYVSCSTNDAIYQYSLSTAWDISTASYDSKSLSVSTQDGTPLGFDVSNDGYTFVMLGASSDTLYSYTLTTAWDVSTGSYSGKSFSVASQETNPSGVYFKSDGTKMYVTGYASDAVYQYTTGNVDYPTSSPITVTGLTNGTSYTFNVWAINAFGYSAPSDASGSVTPSFTERAFFLGGTIGVSPDRTNEIDHFTIATTGNATDWGDLTSITDFGAGCGSSTRGIYFFGRNSAGNKVNNIDYFDTASTGNSSDFGDNTSAKYTFAGASNSTRGLAAGGDGQINDIRYITIASTGNATDFGDMTIARSDLGGCASSTRACFGGGFNSGTPSLYNLNIIDYVTIGTTGNATDFGDLTAGRNGCGSSSSSTRGLFFGGNNTNIIDYITIASTGNATDFGDLSSTSWSGGASAAGTTRALYGGTSNNAGNVAYVTIASTGNASDFGDLQLTGGTSIKRSLGACSNAHGGL